MSGISDSDRSTLVYLGHITKPHGIRGELALYYEGEDPNTLLGDILLEAPSSPSQPPKAAQSAVISKVRMHHSAPLITINGITTRDQAEAHRGYAVYVQREKLPELSENDYYLTDMIGLTVIAEDELGNQQKLGTIERVDIPAGQELWLIRTAKNQEILFPAVPEFVLRIDLDAEEVHITPPPGLIELYTT